MIENGLSMVIVKDSEVVVQRKARGIEPLFTAVLEKRDLIAGGVLADKVIGKAAAMLSVEAGIKHIYTKMISENAIQVLKHNNISFEYELKVPYILNRTKSDACPVEKMAKDEENIEYLLKKIGNFLKT
nr:DUF1893 domain-containing protein [Clostridium aestuarii]